MRFAERSGPPTDPGEGKKKPEGHDKSTDPAQLYSRRDFLRDATKTIVALSLGEIISLSLRKKEIRRIEGVPDFVMEPSPDNREEYIPDNIIELIDQAWKKLEAEKVNFTKTPVPQKDPAKEPVEKIESEVVLAAIDLLNKHTDLEVLRMSAKGELEENQEDEGHQVQIGERLGVGTGYEVTVPDQHVVLATRQIIKLREQPTEVTYSPYTPDLDVPAVRLVGFQYLVNLLKTAKEELTKKGIKSAISGSKEIAEGVPFETAMMLTIVEQIDPGVFNNRSKKLAAKFGISAEEADIHTAKSMTNKALTVGGENRKMWRVYARSNKGASGLFQLMPDTYHSLAGFKKNKQGKLEKVAKPRYPNTGLTPDFLEGATEHGNAAQAAILLLDSDLKDAGEHRESLLKDPVELGQYLSACYNAGSPTIINWRKKHGKNWPKHIPPEYDETRIYIRKYMAVQALFKNQVKALPELTGAASDKSLTERNRSGRRELNDIPDALQGGAASLAKQINRAKKEGIEFVATQQRLDELVKAGKLVPLPASDLIKINPTLAVERRYCLPQTAKFLTDMAAASRTFNPGFEPLMVNSAARPEDFQAEMRDPKSPKYNPNATTRSSHPTGATVDLAYNANASYKGMSLSQLEWTERYLVDLEKKNLVEAVEERNQTVFHVMTFREYLKK